MSVRVGPDGEDYERAASPDLGDSRRMLVGERGPARSRGSSDGVARSPRWRKIDGMADLDVGLAALNGVLQASMLSDDLKKLGEGHRGLWPTSTFRCAPARSKRSGRIEIYNNAVIVRFGGKVCRTPYRFTRACRQSRREVSRGAGRVARRPVEGHEASTIRQRARRQPSPASSGRKFERLTG